MLVFCLDFEPIDWFQVIIEGFKTYKDQTISDPFSSKINCVGKIIFLLWKKAKFWRKILVLNGWYSLGVQLVQTGLASPTFSMVSVVPRYLTRTQQGPKPVLLMKDFLLLQLFGLC